MMKMIREMDLTMETEMIIKMNDNEDDDDNRDECGERNVTSKRSHNIADEEMVKCAVEMSEGSSEIHGEIRQVAASHRPILRAARSAPTK